MIGSVTVELEWYEELVKTKEHYELLVKANKRLVKEVKYLTKENKVLVRANEFLAKESEDLMKKLLIERGIV